MIILKILVSLQCVALLTALSIMCVDVARGFDIDYKWARIAGFCMGFGLILFLAEIFGFTLYALWVAA